LTIKDEKSAAKFHYIKTLSGKLVAQSIAFRVVSIYWQGVAPFPWYLNAKAGRHSIRTNQCSPPPSPYFLQAGCPSCHPTNGVKALKATSAFRLGRRR